MIYVTYYLDGVKKMANITKDMYAELLNNPMVTELQIHPDEPSMKECFTGEKQKKILKG